MSCIHAQLAAIREQAKDLPLPSSAKRVLTYLLDLAARSGRPDIVPTNARIGEELGYCRRTIQYAFRELEEAGLGVRKGGVGYKNRPDIPNMPAVWTFTAPCTLID